MIVGVSLWKWVCPCGRVHHLLQGGTSFWEEACPCAKGYALDEGVGVSL